MSIQIGSPCKWTIDAKWFILDSFDMIRESPSEIYNVALALCPPSSWLHRHYPTRATRVKVLVGPTGWGTCIRTVSCSTDPLALACWKDTIAIGTLETIIVMYDALTGSQTAILSGHTGYVKSLVFSSDGTLLVSGSYDGTIKLWDVQTGGVVKTLHGHNEWVYSVSISADSTMIASVSDGKTIHLWNVETRDCLAVGVHRGLVGTVSFSPTVPQILLSSYHENTVQQWSIDGQEIGSPIAGSHVAFSPDGTWFVSCMEETITIRNTSSKMTLLQFDVVENPRCCYFSPDGRFIVVITGQTIGLWDITGPEPCIFQTLNGHTKDITCLAFSSSSLLISVSGDEMIKFWQIDPSLVSPGIPSPQPSLPASIPIKAVSLQAKDGLAFSIDSEGVVKIWDILTGLCKKSIMTPAKDIHYGDMQAISGGLVISWCMRDGGTYIWNAQQGEDQKIGIENENYGGLRISGDGSRVFYVDDWGIQSWSIETQKHIRNDSVAIDRFLNPLCMNNSKILVQLGISTTEVWDFGAPDSTCIQLSEISSDRPRLNLIDFRFLSPGSLVRIEDGVTKKDVFQLYGKYGDPYAMQWDGQYLVAGYTSGEVLVLDLGQMLVE